MSIYECLFLIVKLFFGKDTKYFNSFQRRIPHFLMDALPFPAFHPITDVRGTDRPLNTQKNPS